MNKKNYLIISITVLFFIAIIIPILLLNNNKKNWTDDILNSQNYQLVMTDCNGREKELDKYGALTSLNSNWKKLSNNGPWTGNDNICYTTLTISYENNGVINKKEVLIIDSSSIAFIENNNSTYYTQASEIISYLNTLFME